MYGRRPPVTVNTRVGTLKRVLRTIELISQIVQAKSEYVRISGTVDVSPFSLGPIALMWSDAA